MKSELKHGGPRRTTEKGEDWKKREDSQLRERVTVQPCDARGKAKAGSDQVDATARLVTGDELEQIRRAIVEKYGFMTTVTKSLGTLGGIVKRNRIPYGDRGVVPRTALVERTDFAAGTSSMSSKMIHGGIRYLQQFEIRLVYQSLRERQRLLQNAPHLVRVLPFAMAIYNNGGMIPRFFAWILSPVLWFYDVTGGAKIGHRHRRLTREETIAHMPTLDPERIHSSYLYYDAQVDDADHVLAKGVRTDDPWGHRYRIQCDRARVTVHSPGSDGKASTADDIRVSEPWSS